MLQAGTPGQMLRRWRPKDADPSKVVAVGSAT